MRSRLLLLLLSPVLGVLGCSTEEAPDYDVAQGGITKPGEESPAWLYEGPLPALESPQIVTSISGHTMRVSGLLPATYDVRRLPYYVVTEPAGDRVRMHVVYPVATGRFIRGQWNNVPGHYDHLNVRPFRPNNPNVDREHWGGFPFLNYHDARRFAMHGPIDYVEDFDAPEGAATREDWRLVRGRVSLGCQRMQGEHVLELTHLLGFDMSKPWTTALAREDPRNGVPGRYIPISLTVLAEPELDRYDGAIVDVDYPKHDTVPPLPAGERVQMFRTWNANDMRAWACSLRPEDDPNVDRSVARSDGRFDGHYCARTHGANRFNPATGR